MKGTYYHINRTLNCTWKIGDEIAISDDNYFWQSFTKNEEYIEINKEKIDVYKIATNAFDVYAKQYPVPKKIIGYHFDALRTLKETIDCLGIALKCNRELVFETIRKEFYPDLPSRQKCIWIIPDHIESLEFWRNILENTEKRIFKISATGKIHRASQKWLVGGTFSLDKLNSLAHSYWRGENIGSTEDEILLEGRFKIIDEITD